MSKRYVVAVATISESIDIFLFLILFTGRVVRYYERFHGRIVHYQVLRFELPMLNSNQVGWVDILSVYLQFLPNQKFVDRKVEINRHIRNKIKLQQI